MRPSAVFRSSSTRSVSDHRRRPGCRSKWDARLYTVNGHVFDAVDGRKDAGDTGFEGLGPATRNAQ